MRVGISRPSRPEELSEVLEAARRHGFEGVQLKQNQYERFVAEPDAFRRELGDLCDLARGGLIVYPGGDTSTWEAKVSPVIPFAAAVGAGHVCMCCAVGREDASDARFKAVAETLTGIGRKARDAGVAVSLHNHADSLFESEDEIARLVDLLDPALCGITLDTGHTAKAGIADPGPLVRRFRSHLLNLHLKDLDDEGRFSPLGTGNVNLAAALEALGETGYDGWLVVDEESKHVPLDEAFRISAEYLRGKGIMS